MINILFYVLIPTMFAFMFGSVCAAAIIVGTDSDIMSTFILCWVGWFLAILCTLKKL